MWWIRQTTTVQSLAEPSNCITVSVCVNTLFYRYSSCCDFNPNHVFLKPKS